MEALRLAPILGMVAACLALAACESTPNTEPPAVVRTLPPPGYASVAARYNERVARLDKLWARAVVRLKYVDDKGEQHEEQGEGLLQVVRPERMALSIKKAGKMLFWFGGDTTRYWLFDVVDKPVVRVGRHEFIGTRAADAGLGLDINPREMIRLLGITPLPIVAAQRPGSTTPVDPGTTAWSKNGRHIEVTTPVATGGKQVLSLDPDTLIPQKIALTDAAGRPLVSADLDTYEPVDIANYGGIRPRIAARVNAVHPSSKTEIKLDLSEMKNDGVSDKAFQFDELRRALGVDNVIDLDAPPAGAKAATSKTPTSAAPSP